MGRQRDERGFTVIELMVVVGVIGILAAVAGAQYRKFVSKSRQSEAKIYLGAAFIAERAWAAEYLSHTACMRQTGFVPEGGTRYYSVEIVVNDAIIAGSGTARCGPNENQSCDWYNWAGAGKACVVPPGPVPVNTALTAFDSAFAATQVANVTVTIPPLTPTHSYVSKGQFIIMALGGISSSSSNADIWTINELRTLENLSPGL